MSVSDKLTQLTDIRSDIRNALVEQGVEAGTHNFADFAGDIADISGGDLEALLESLDNAETEEF